MENQKCVRLLHHQRSHMLEVKEKPESCGFPVIWAFSVVGVARQGWHVTAVNILRARQWRRRRRPIENQPTTIKFFLLLRKLCPLVLYTAAAYTSMMWKGRNLCLAERYFIEGFFLWWWSLSRAGLHKPNPPGGFFGDYYYFFVFFFFFFCQIPSTRYVDYCGETELKGHLPREMPCCAVYSITIKSQMERRELWRRCV